MKTELCDVLGIEYPIIQGAMAHISDGKFAATVSEAGGLGVIASTLHDGQWVKEQVEIARSITDKPFAVNLIMESDIVEECARMCVELKVPICTISAGNPEKIVPILVEGGIKVICLIPPRSRSEEDAGSGRDRCCSRRYGGRRTHRQDVHLPHGAPGCRSGGYSRYRSGRHR